MKTERKDIKPLLVFILGPSGVGKSEFAVKLAKRIKGEIISCDSMQIYKGMAIMSQQPKSKLRKAVRHHLIGAVSPSGEWSAARFIREARKIIEDIIRRARIPIIVGGTGLYARALIKGLFPSPPKDERLRNRLYNEAGRKGNKRLYERLIRIDPAYASKIHPNDLRRVIRALEVYELTGRPISEQHIESTEIKENFEAKIFILNRPRKVLYDRINDRVEKMFVNGIVSEVKKLKRLRMGRTAKAVLGYKEINGYIKGDYGLAEAKELLRKNTRHYAKRQMTWFRKEKDAIWLELSTNKRNNALVKAIARSSKAIAVEPIAYRFTKRQ